MKLLVIGLDGASLRFLHPFLEAGTLPNLADLMARGRWGTLRSTVPPATAPAWVSCFSGVNPGRHGIFNFVRPVGLGRLSACTSADVQVPRLWHMLGHLGWTVHVVDVPLTSPPEQVTGVMVADLMTAGVRRAHTWPPTLARELERRVGARFRWAIADGLEVSRAYLKHLARSVGDKLRLDCYLLEQYPADALVTVYQHLDVLCHYFWHVLDPAHPAFHPRLARRLTPSVEAVLTRLDGALGRLVTLAGSDALVVIVSDHGFGPARSRIHVNDLLVRWGMLRLNDSARLVLEARRLGLRPARLASLAARLDVVGIRRMTSLRAARKAMGVLDHLGMALDGRGTAAWFPHGLSPGIVVYENGPHREAFVERLVSRLRNLRGPDRGGPCFEVVARREEVYRGPWVDRAPHIVLQPAEGYVLTAEIAGGGGFEAPLPGQVTGYHRPEGVYVFAGPSVEQTGRGGDASIQDVVPTLLAAFGAERVAVVDGACVSGVAVPGGAVGPGGRSVGLVDRRGGGGQEEVVLSQPGDTAEVVERLEALGYI